MIQNHAHVRDIINDLLKFGYGLDSISIVTTEPHGLFEMADIMPISSVVMSGVGYLSVGGPIRTALNGKPEANLSGLLIDVGFTHSQADSFERRVSKEGVLMSVLVQDDLLVVCATEILTGQGGYDCSVSRQDPTTDTYACQRENAKNCKTVIMPPCIQADTIRHTN